MSRDTTDKLLYGIFGLLLCAGAVLLYKFLTLEVPTNQDIAPPVQGSSVQPRSSKAAPTGAYNPNLIGSFPEKKLHVPKIDFQKEIKLKSLVSQRRFSQTTYLKLPLPGHLTYLDVDIEDGVRSIYGYNRHSKEGLTAAARLGPTTIEEVQQYLKEDSDAVPNLNGRKLSNISKPRSIPGAYKRPGIKDVQVMSADLDNGQKAHVALVNRKDEKGSYMFVYTGPPGRIENNDGYLEKIFSQMEALEPPKQKKSR